MTKLFLKAAETEQPRAWFSRILLVLFRSVLYKRRTASAGCSVILQSQFVLVLEGIWPRDDRAPRSSTKA